MRKKKSRMMFTKYFLTRACATHDCMILCFPETDSTNSLVKNANLCRNEFLIFKYFSIYLRREFSLNDFC